MTRRLAALVLVVLAAAGCTYRGAEDPATRKFTWFSYLNGDDIRARCEAGAPERYRLVYNAVYREQVRAYDITVRPEGGARMVSRINTEANLADLRIETGPGDLLDPWRDRKTVTDLRPEDVDTLRRSLRASGAFGPAPEGLRMISEDFYWITVACHDGAVAFNAYKWPSERFKQASFDEVLFALDFSDVPVNPPRKIGPYEYKPSEVHDWHSFRLRVGENGLWGIN